MRATGLGKGVNNYIHHMCKFREAAWRPGIGENNKAGLEGKQGKKKAYAIDVLTVVQFRQEYLEVETHICRRRRWEYTQPESSKLMVHGIGIPPDGAQTPLRELEEVFVKGRIHFRLVYWNCRVRTCV